MRALRSVAPSSAPLLITASCVALCGSAFAAPKAQVHRLPAASPAPAHLAEDQQPLPAPHDGATAPLDARRHLELVVDKKGLSLWLVDARGTLLPVAATTFKGRIAVKDRPVSTVTFAAAGDHVRADLDLETALWIDVVVTVGEKGKAARQVSLRWGLLNRKDVGFGNPLDGLQL